MESLTEHLQTNHKTLLEQLNLYGRRYYKSSLIGLSHAIEDVVFYLNLNAVMFVSFQDIKFFFQEEKRYRALARHCAKIYIFCKETDTNELPDIDNLIFIPLKTDAPMTEEWDIIVYHPTVSIMFAAREVATDLIDEEMVFKKSMYFDDFRRFRGFLSFSPQIINRAVDFFNQQLNEWYGVDPSPYLTKLHGEANANSAKTAQFFYDETLMRFFDHFMNNSLFSLESKNHELLKKTTQFAKMYDHIEKMKQIHDKFLPKSIPDIEGLDIAVGYYPSQQVGSDFYQFETKGDKFVFYIVDVTGHGFEGALINIFIRETIKYLVHDELKEAKINAEEMMNRLAKYFANESFPEDQFACVVIGVYTIATGKLELCNAGIEIPPIVFKSSNFDANNKAFEYLTHTSGLPLSSAIDSNLLTYNQTEMALAEHDLVFISTDGVASDTNGEQSLDMVKNKILKKWGDPGQRSSQDILSHLEDEIFYGGNNSSQGSKENTSKENTIEMNSKKSANQHHLPQIKDCIENFLFLDEKDDITILLIQKNPSSGA